MERRRGTGRIAPVRWQRRSSVTWCLLQRRGKRTTLTRRSQRGAGGGASWHVSFCASTSATTQTSSACLHLAPQDLKGLTEFESHPLRHLPNFVSVAGVRVRVPVASPPACGLGEVNRIPPSPPSHTCREWRQPPDHPNADREEPVRQNASRRGRHSKTIFVKQGHGTLRPGCRVRDVAAGTAIAGDEGPERG